MSQVYDPCSWKFEAKKIKILRPAFDLIPNTLRKRKIIINLFFPLSKIIYLCEILNMILHDLKKKKNKFEMKGRRIEF